MQEFPLHNPDRFFSSTVESVSALGTIHHHRNRWNPFTAQNELSRSKDHTWLGWFSLSPHGGRHGDGVYNLRFILNHNPRRPLKLGTWHSGNALVSDWTGEGSQLSAILQEDALGRGSQNLSFRVHKLCSVCILVDPDQQVATLSTEIDRALSPVVKETSYELNGFVWDELDAFGKFDERRVGRAFQRIADDHWRIIVPLRTSGGIDFRHDGVYQFLISRNGDEDQGFAAINGDGVQDSLELIGGTGFGSSHGTCRHSAPTLKVSEDGLHTFDLFRQGKIHRLAVHGPSGAATQFCNHSASTIQLLGTIFSENGFDPTQPQSWMKADANGNCFYSELHLISGTYSINFAIGNELFLDTMGLGCWLQHDGPGLRGIGWHGKPNEINILFHVHRAGRYCFHYNRLTDEFGIDPLALPATVATSPLEAVVEINTLSLVGNFEAPLASWQPDADANLMSHLGAQRFEKLVKLNARVTYQFKFVANRTNWLLVFADYEFDGFGMTYDTPQNPQPFDSQLATLKFHGQLTTHGNPPAISYVPKQTGWYRFSVDLNTGAYAVSAMPG